MQIKLQDFYLMLHCLFFLQTFILKVIIPTPSYHIVMDLLSGGLWRPLRLITFLVGVLLLVLHMFCANETMYNNKIICLPAIREATHFDVLLLQHLSETCTAFEIQA